MIRAVHQGGFHADQREAGQHALLGAVHETFFDRREEVLRHRAAEHGLFKNEAFAIPRLELDPHVAELAVTAGLFLVAALHLDLLADGLAVGDTRGRVFDLHAEFGFELGRHDVQMLLTETRQHRFLGFGVELVMDGGILFHQTVEAGRDLLFVALLLGEHRHRQRRRFKVHLVEGHDIVRRAQRVAGLGGDQLRHTADIAGGDDRGLFLLLAADVVELADLLGGAGAAVDQRGVGFDLTADNFEVQQLAHKRVSDGLEHDRDGRAVRVDRQRHFLAVLVDPGLAGDGLRPRCQIIQAVKQGGNAVQRDRRTAEHRGDLAAAHAGREAGFQLFGGKRLAGEVFFHQLFARLGDRFLDHGADLVEVVEGRHRGLGRFAVFVGVRLVVDEVDVALHGAVHDVRIHHRAERFTEPRLQLGEGFVEIGVLGVQLIDEEDLGDALLAGGAVRLFGTDGKSAFGGHHDQRATGGAHALGHAAREVKQTGGVQQVDFDAVPFHRQDRGGDRGFALDLFRVEVADGGAVRHLTEAVGFAGQIVRRFGQGGFSHAGVTEQNDISDLFGGIRFQLKNSFPDVRGELAQNRQNKPTKAPQTWCF